MTDKPISGLTELTEASADDVIAIVNAAETKKITTLNFLNSGIVGAELGQMGWGFASPVGVSGTFYTGGYYDFGGSSNNFSPAINFGTANSSYAAHFMIVLGETTVDELTLRVTGTSINDNAVRTASDTEDIVIPNVTAANAFYETAKKWIGQVNISVVSGTPKLCNYGFNKYWDRNNTDFQVSGLEAVWQGGANDSGANISLIHHQESGWTYGAGGTPTPPYIARMNTDHVTEVNIVNGESGAWKRANLSETILGSASEGLVVEIVTTANRAFGVNSNINVTISQA